MGLPALRQQPLPQTTGAPPCRPRSGVQGGRGPTEHVGETRGPSPMGLGVTGDKQRGSGLTRGALGGIEQRGPKCGLRRSDQRVKALCPAPGRGLAVLGGVAGGRAHVCRSCGWAGPGRGAGGARSGAGPAPRAPPGGLWAAPASRAGGVGSEDPTPDLETASK